MKNVCTCGDDIDDHGGDPKFPGSTACKCDGCECVAFEAEDDGANTVRCGSCGGQRSAYGDPCPHCPPGHDPNRKKLRALPRSPRRRP